MLTILLLIFGILVIVLGRNGYKPEGIPWSSTKRLTGTLGRRVGLSCILFGACIAGFALVVMLFGR